MRERREEHIWADQEPGVIDENKGQQWCGSEEQCETGELEIGVKKIGGKGQEGKRNHGTVIKAKPQVEREETEANRNKTIKENSETNFMAQPWASWNSSWNLELGDRRGLCRNTLPQVRGLECVSNDFCWQERGGR